MKKKTLTAIATLVLTTLAHAEEPASSWFVGAGVGQSHMAFNAQDFRVNPSIAAGGFTASPYETANGTSFNFYGGYQLSKNWAVKAEFIDFGKQKWGYNIAGGNANSDLTVKGFSLAGVGTIPIMEKVSLIGEAGALLYDAKRSPTHSGTVVPLTGTPEVSTKQGLAPYLAVGVQYAITKEMSLVGKYSYYGEIGSEEDFGRAKLSNLNLSIQYSF